MASTEMTPAQVTHAQTIKAQLYGIDISFTVLAVLAVVLRFWARYRSAGQYGWDDWLVLISLFVVFMNFACNAIIEVIENGLGLQATEVPLESLVNIGKAIFADEMVYLLVLALIKIAILVMYCRVFPLRGFRIGAWILSTLTVIWSIMFIFLCIFQCDPIPRAWNLTIPGKCLNLRAIYIGNGLSNIVTDAAILCMPLYHVWKLQIRTAQRLALTGIFLLGAFVIVASIYRFTKVLELDPMNLSYTLKEPTTWSHVEVTVALISACLPTMRPLLIGFLNLVGLNNSSRNGTGGEHSARREGSSVVKPIKKKPHTGLTEFSVLDEGHDGWLTPSQNVTNEEIPLKGIQVTRHYEQKVEMSPEDHGWLDDRRRKSWYPGDK